MALDIKKGGGGPMRRTPFGGYGNYPWYQNEMTNLIGASGEESNWLSVPPDASSRVVITKPYPYSPKPYTPPDPNAPPTLSSIFGPPIPPGFGQTPPQVARLPKARPGQVAAPLKKAAKKIAIAIGGDLKKRAQSGGSQGSRSGSGTAGSRGYGSSYGAGGYTPGVYGGAGGSQIGTGVGGAFKNR